MRYLIALLLLTQSLLAANYSFILAPGDTLSISVSNCPPCPTNSPPPQTNGAAWNVVFDGDSHTEANGTPYPGGATAYGDVADLVAAMHPAWTVQNFALGGQSMAMMLADAMTQVDGAYNSNAPVNICVVEPGAAEWLVHGGRQWVLFEQVAQYVRDRRARGWTVVLASFPNSTNVQAQQQIDLWTNYSAVVRGCWPDLAHGFVDLAGRFTNWSDQTVYQPDFIHLNPAGTAIYATMADQAITNAGNAKLAGNPLQSPFDTAGVVAWWEGSHQFYKGLDGVTNLIDASGNYRNLTQSTTGRQPMFVGNWVNGRPALSFDGINDMLGRADGWPASNYTVLVSMQIDHTNQNIQHIVSSDYGGHWLYLTPYLSPGSLFAENDDCNSAGKLPIGSPVTVVVTMSAARNARFFVDGVFDSADSAATAYAQNGTIRLGDYTAPGNQGPVVPFKGLIGAVVVWNRTLNDAEAVKWGQIYAGKY